MNSLCLEKRLARQILRCVGDTHNTNTRLPQKDHVIKAGALKGDRTVLALKILNKIKAAQNMGGIGQAMAAIQQEVQIQVRPGYHKSQIDVFEGTEFRCHGIWDSLSNIPPHPARNDDFIGKYLLALMESSAKKNVSKTATSNHALSCPKTIDASIERIAKLRESTRPLMFRFAQTKLAREQGSILIAEQSLSR